MSSETPTIIRRPDKGLTISGTRVTLYALMDYLRAGWPHDEIREWLNLTDAQLAAALDYIAAHGDEFEAEYEEVVRKDEERRRYHEQLVRDHLACTPPKPITAEKAALVAKLVQQQRQSILELLGEDQAQRNGAVHK